MRAKGHDVIWMAITPDEYELPFEIGDSARQLARRLTELTGIPITDNQVKMKAYHYGKMQNHRSPRGTHVQFRIVEVNMDGYEE